jgi:hypothetical protein
VAGSIPDRKGFIMKHYIEKVNYIAHHPELTEDQQFGMLAQAIIINEMEMLVAELESRE